MKRQPRMLMNKTWPLMPVGWADNEIGPLSAACQKFSREVFTRGVTMWSLVSLSSRRIFSQFPALFVHLDMKAFRHGMHFFPLNKNEILTVDWTGVFFFPHGMPEYLAPRNSTPLCF